MRQKLEGKTMNTGTARIESWADAGSNKELFRVVIEFRRNAETLTLPNTLEDRTRDNAYRIFHAIQADDTWESVFERYKETR